VIRTPDQRLRVFVSSTLQELAPERAAVRDAITRLRLVPVMFELGARPHPPRDLYRAYLAQSHVFVGIYWERYGWVAPDMEVSGLEDEWVGAAPLAKLVYIKQPAPDREPRLGALLDRIRDGNTTSYRSFSTPDELRELVENDLAVLLSERFESVASNDPAGTALVDVPDTLPHAPSAFIGREAEVATLRELLEHGETRMVTVTGPGGSGKTRLAIEVADQLRAALGWRVCFVDLTGLRSPSLVVPAIAGVLGIRDAGGRSLVEAIATVIADQPLLLVVDNLEHLIDAAVELGEILAVTANVKMLVTSRQALHLRWEQELPLLPLQVPAEDQTSMDAVAASGAVDLLVERARRVRPSFRLTEQNASVVAEITRRLDGLPLALELAAARLRVLSPEDLLARLEHRLDALAGTSPDMPLRHRTLREAISWSYDLLPGDEQALFRRMGVFAGGAGLEAIEAVCASDGIDPSRVLDVVTSLVEKSLIVSAGAGDLGSGRTRVCLLATIQEFALEKLVAAGELDGARDRHLAWHAALAEQAWSRFWTADMPAWLDVLELEHDNVRAALDHAVTGAVERGLRIAASLWPFWDVRGHYREGERRLRALLAVAPSTASVEYGRALSALGWLVALLGDFEQAMTLMSDGLPVVRAAGSTHQLAWSLLEQGNVAFSLGRADDADRLFTEALALGRELDETFVIGFALFGLAYVGFLRGDMDAMSSRLHESLELTRVLTQPWGIAWAQFSLGVVSVMRGDTRGAVTQITESLQQRWSIGDTRGMAESLQVLATLASGHGQPRWSAYLHGAAEVQREANGLTILPFLRPMHDESVARLRAALDSTTLDQLWQLGRSTPLEKTVLEALAPPTMLDAEPGRAAGATILADV
jgi:predicted ATPase